MDKKESETDKEDPLMNDDISKPEHERTDVVEVRKKKAIESIRAGVGSVFSVISGSKKGVAETRAQMTPKSVFGIKDVSLKDLAFPKSYTPPTHHTQSNVEKHENKEMSPAPLSKQQMPRPSPQDLGITAANELEQEQMEEAAHRTSLPYTKEHVVGADRGGKRFSAREMLLAATSFLSGKKVEPKIRPQPDQMLASSTDVSDVTKESGETETKITTETETAAPKTDKESSWLRPLRTYAGDVAESIKKKKTSFVSMVAAEEKKRAALSHVSKETPSSPFISSWTRVVIIGASTILVVSGVLSVVFFYTVRERSGVTLPEARTESLIFTETEDTFSFDGRRGDPLLRELSSYVDSTSITLNTMKYVVMTEESVIGTHVVDAVDLFDALGASLRSSATRSFHPDFTFGIHAFNRNQPFLIFKTDSFELAFRGMLDWETAMSSELAPWFGLSVAHSLLPPSETGTPSPRVLSGMTFIDRVIENRDTRVLFDEDGSIALLYSFLDKETLVITTNLDSFKEIVARYSRRRVQ